MPVEEHFYHRSFEAAKVLKRMGGLMDWSSSIPF